MSTEEADTEEWAAAKPDLVAKRIREYPPEGLYRLDVPSGRFHVVELFSYNESTDGQCDTATVTVLREHNPDLSFERRVFGIRFDDLTPVSEGTKGTGR